MPSCDATCSLSSGHGRLQPDCVRVGHPLACDPSVRHPRPWQDLADVANTQLRARTQAKRSGRSPPLSTLLARRPSRELEKRSNGTQQMNMLGRSPHKSSHQLHKPTKGNSVAKCTAMRPRASACDRRLSSSKTGIAATCHVERFTWQCAPTSPAGVQSRKLATSPCWSPHTCADVRCGPVLT